MLARLPRPPGRNLRIGTSEAGLCNLHESQSWQPAAAEAQLAKRSEAKGVTAGRRWIIQWSHQKPH